MRVHHPLPLQSANINPTIQTLTFHYKRNLIEAELKHQSKFKTPLLIQSTAIEPPESMSGVNNGDRKKSGTGDHGAHITLKVKTRDGSEVYFRMNRSTQLKKLLIAYCDRKSIPHNVVTFLFAGRPFRREQTPDELKMEEGDEIKAIFHQTVEQRLYFDQLVAETIALEEEVIRLRKDYKEEGGLLIRIRRVKRVVSKLIADDSAIKEELTRLRKDEEEDGVFLKMGRLLTERIADSSPLREKLSRLWKDEEEDNEEDEDDEEDEEEDEEEEEDDEEEDDALFMEIGKIVFEVLDKSG